VDGDNRPIKSILKKSSTTSSSSQNGTKKESKKMTRKVSRVNYAFQSDENDQDLNQSTSSATVKIVAEVH